MKESGIDWIGQIPEEWELGRVKDFYKFFTGFTPDTSRVEYYGDINDFVWVTIADMTSKKIESSKQTLSDIFIKEKRPQVSRLGSLLYSFKLSVGKVAFANSDLYTNEAIATFEDGPNINLRFLYYSSYLIEFNSETNIYGAKLLNSDRIRNACIVQPSLSEQTKIADFLDKKTAQLDKAKALLEEQIQKLKDYRASLIYETVTKGLDKTVPMKDSGIDWIGQVPQGWGVSKLKFILEKGINSIKVGPFGSSLSGDAIRSSGKWVYNQRNVLDNNFTETDFYISEAKCKELKNFSVSSGDILLTTRGTIGRVAIVPKKYCEGIIHPCLMKFKVDSKIVLPELIKYLFNDIPLVREQLNFLSNSTTIDVIYSYNLKNIIIPIIPIEEQYSTLEVLDRQTSDVDSLIKIKQKHIENINKQRQTLIYDYVTGKRRV